MSADTQSFIINICKKTSVHFKDEKVLVEAIDSLSCLFKILFMNQGSRDDMVIFI